MRPLCAPPVKPPIPGRHKHGMKVCKSGYRLTQLGTDTREINVDALGTQRNGESPVDFIFNFI